MSVVEAMVEAELDRWRAARERQALIEGEWGAPPGVPVQGDGRVVLDPTGRHALLIGYRAVHLLDLRTMRARALVSDARSDRAGAFSPDGRHAVVSDTFGRCLHWITLDDDPCAERLDWDRPPSLRGEHLVALDDDGRVAVVGPDIDEAPLHAQWIDGPTGAVQHTTKITAEQHGATCAAAAVRFADDATLHIRLTDPPSEAIALDPIDRRPRRVPAVLGRIPRGPWRLKAAGGRRQLESSWSKQPIDVPRPRAALHLSGSPEASRVAVAVDGQVRLYDTATGQPVGARLTAPGRARFTRIDRVVLTADRLWVAGVAPSSPLSSADVPLLAGWRRVDDAWRPLGVVLLADRAVARGPKRRERMSNVYVKGVQLSVAQLEAKGITFIGDDDPEASAAQARFACPRDDPYDREVPFARTPRGLFGRLDADRPLGPDPAEPFERPATTAALLRGETPDFDDATRAALDDWRDRLTFWRALEHIDEADDLRRLMDASAGLGDLLPEIVHRAPGRKGRPPSADALVRVAEKTKRRSAADREVTVFREMLLREERRLRPELLRARLRATCPTLSESAADAAIAALGSTVEAVADAAAGGASHLALTDVADGAALADLLVAARNDLPVERLDLTGSAIDDDGLARLVETPWATLRHLDLARTAVTDRGAVALATAAGFESLESIDLDDTATGLPGRAALRWSATLPALRDPLTPLEGWIGLLGLTAPPDALSHMLARLWDAAAATPALGDADGPRVGHAAVAGAPTLVIERVPIAPPALHALAKNPRVTRLGRLALRACELDDDATDALISLRDALPATTELDLRDNRLDLGFALRWAMDDPDISPPVALHGNPIAPVGWGALRGALGDRLRGAPDDALGQLRAVLGLDTVPSETRALWLGRALADLPALAEPLLGGIEPETLRALLPELSRAATTCLDAALWRTISAFGLRLSARRPATWWLGAVHCEATDDRLVVQPDRPLSDAQLRIEVEPDRSRLRKLIDGQDVLTGDDDFDRIALISGDPGVALALLDGEVRAALIPHLAAGLNLTDGRLVRPPLADPAALVALAEVAARLVTPDVSLPAIWARRLAEERTPATALRLARALTTSDPPADLVPLTLAAESPVEPARRLIGAALCARVEPEEVARLGPAACAAALEEAPGTLRPALIRRLHAVGDERAVAPLTRLADAFFGGRDIKQAARAAVEAIVERQGGLRAGGLTVVARTPTGGLSVSGPGSDEQS